ncbi:MAG: S8 family peptidase [Acidobacteria bacterium]|nr:S8 family peptidase [Acidobacteriota bacterium]
MRKQTLLALALAAAPLSAQSPARLPVIVVLQDQARFQDFARSHAPDARHAASPEAWGYLDRGVAGSVQFLERRIGFQADHVYSAALRGFSARLSAREIEQLENDALVRYIEPDGTMSVVAQTLPWGIDRVNADISSTLAGNGSGAVSGVNIYVIDTGVATHQDINMVRHVNFVGFGTNSDCNGHGTHVAGTIAARDNTVDVVGVVPGAPVTGVKVLGCNGSGTTSGVIKGIDWVTANHSKPAVANMSLGGGASQALDDAVRRSVAAGVFYAIAAGNSGADACLQSPARAGAGTDNGILTVAAMDINNAEPSWSNFGSCVDIWAPGVNILSTSRTGGTITMSGTSMAAPHGAGAAALYHSIQTTAPPAMIESALKAAAVATGTSSKDGRAIRRVEAGTF